jgi:hypothetical protein
MTEPVFCYSCRTDHPLNQMQQFRTRHGLRWRCRRTIAAAKSSVAEREVFGRQQTEINLNTAEKLARQHLLSFREGYSQC